MVNEQSSWGAEKKRGLVAGLSSVLKGKTVFGSGKKRKNGNLQKTMAVWDWSVYGDR